jgi:hypothetical protein
VPRESGEANAISQLHSFPLNTVIAANFFFTKHEFGSSVFTRRRSSGPGVTAIRAVPTTLCTSAHVRACASALLSRPSSCRSK